MKFIMVISFKKMLYKKPFYMCKNNDLKSFLSKYFAIKKKRCNFVPEI